MDKRVKVVMLPTKEKAGLVINPSTNKIQYVDFEKNSKYYTEASFICNHLYITSDDEIKEGDWCYNEKRKTIIQGKYMIKTCELVFCKKIIATTDSSLVYYLPEDINKVGAEHSLPQPSQSFIQKYVEEYNKGNQIVDVLVEYDGDWDEHYQGYYAETVVPKLSKDNTITIRRVKDSWTRDEIVELIYNFAYDLTEKRKTAPLYQRYDKWIEENL